MAVRDEVRSNALDLSFHSSYWPEEEPSSLILVFVLAHGMETHQMQQIDVREKNGHAWHVEGRYAIRAARCGG